MLSATITYPFGASLIVSGAPQMILTRYLADRFYVAEIDKVAPTCTGMIVAAAPLSLLTVPFVAFAPFPLVYRLLAASLVLTLTCIWLIVVFLSASRDYFRILLIFVFSYGISIGSIMVMGRVGGVTGSLAGFLFGQVICLALLIARVYREFSPIEGINFGFLRSLGKYWLLGLIGLLYALGIWGDNAVYWFAGHGIIIDGFFRLHPVYDSAKLLAYLATIPASASFLVHLEANFYRHYRDYFRLIREKGTLAQIREHKDGMAEAAQAGLVRIALIQGSIGAAVYAFAPKLALMLGMSPAWVQPANHHAFGVSAAALSGRARAGARRGGAVYHAQHRRHDPFADHPAGLDGRGLCAGHSARQCYRHPLSGRSAAAAGFPDIHGATDQLACGMLCRSRWEI